MTSALERSHDPDAAVIVLASSTQVWLELHARELGAVGASISLKSALDWVRPAGHITKVGWGPQPMNFSMDPLVKKAPFKVEFKE